MSAEAETRLNGARELAVKLRAAAEVARAHERRAVVGFMDEALADNWSWTRIGGALDVSATGARRYYERNRRKVRSV